MITMYEINNSKNFVEIGIPGGITFFPVDELNKYIDEWNKLSKYIPEGTTFIEYLNYETGSSYKSIYGGPGAAKMHTIRLAKGESSNV